MQKPYPANVKMYRNGEVRTFANVMSHTRNDEESEQVEKGVNLIDQALADGWTFDRSSPCDGHTTTRR